MQWRTRQSHDDLVPKDMPWTPLNQQLPKPGKDLSETGWMSVISPAFFYTCATRQALAGQVMAISMLPLALSRGQCGMSHCSSWPFVHIFSWVTAEELSLLFQGMGCDAACPWSHFLTPIPKASPIMACNVTSTGQSCPPVVFLPLLRLSLLRKRRYFKVFFSSH